MKEVSGDSSLSCESDGATLFAGAISGETLHSLANALSDLPRDQAGLRLAASTGWLRFWMQTEISDAAQPRH